jgi:hypothetical protein
VAVAGQLACDGLAAEPAGDVPFEDPTDDRGLDGVDDQVVGGGVDLVAVGPVAAAPLAPGSIDLHAVDDPINDQRPFELGDDAEDLQDHPAGGVAGVERFGGRPERHPGGIEDLEEFGQTAQRAGEPVEPVDQKHVVPAGAGCGERPLQLGPVGGGAGRLVHKGFAGQFPAVLAGDERRQFRFLCLQGERLVLLVCGDPQVYRDPDLTGVGDERSFLAPCSHDVLFLVSPADARLSRIFERWRCAVLTHITHCRSVPPFRRGAGYPLRTGFP